MQSVLPQGATLQSGRRVSHMNGSKQCEIPIQDLTALLRERVQQLPPEQLPSALGDVFAVLTSGVQRLFVGGRVQETTQREGRLDLKLMAEVLGKKPVWLRRQAKLGRIPHFRAGRTYLFDRAEVEQFLREQTAHPLDRNRKPVSSVMGQLVLRTEKCTRRSHGQKKTRSAGEGEKEAIA